jgi:hypothetical protein
METARLDAIVRQRDPALRAIVEQLARGEVRGAVHQLDAQGRVHEITDREERLAAIAREYLRQPDRTLIVSPDNRSRLEINQVIHQARQTEGQVAAQERHVRVLVARREVTGADRQWRRITTSGMSSATRRAATPTALRLANTRASCTRTPRTIT